MEVVDTKILSFVLEHSNNKYEIKFTTNKT